MYKLISRHRRQEVRVHVCFASLVKRISFTVEILLHKLRRRSLVNYLLLSSVIDFSSYKEPFFVWQSVTLFFYSIVWVYLYSQCTLQMKWQSSLISITSNDHKALVQMTFLIQYVFIDGNSSSDYSGKRWLGILSTLLNYSAKNSFSAEEFQVNNYRKTFFISPTFYINTRTSTLNSFLTPASKHPGKHITSSSFQSLTLIYSSTNT